MKITTRKLVVTAVLAAIMLIFGFTPIGYIKIGIVEITLMCLPVIIGTIMEGLIPGLILSVVFIITSFIQLFTGSPLIFLFNLKPFETCLTIIIPRLLIPVTTWAMFRAVCGKEPTLKRQGVAAGVSALVGSLTNTVLFLLMIYLLMAPEFAQFTKTTTETVGAVIATIGATNGLPEAALAIVVTIPIIMALKRIYGRTKTKPEPRSR